MTNPDVLHPPTVNRPFANRLLNLAAATWLAVATIGQWLFGIYILMFYGKTTLMGDFDRWNEVLPDRALERNGAFVVGIHILLAAILALGGPLQLIPWVRRQFPVFHRWLGRVFVITAMVVSAAGLVMILNKGEAGNAIQDISISIQAIYIILFGWLVIRYARSRQFARHRVWALRLFMVVNGVWFFRVGLMFWLVVNGGPVGFDPETFIGPFLTALALFTYAIPLSLIVLELYLLAQRKQDKALCLSISALIFLCTVIMGIGIFGATLGLWLPHM